ncbi:hypothetical protein P3T76_012277 [Phytophthora citrophthora]|uniref:Uncharacterized protein n=1 Tax=Phytophthora citrophthora TaxID=4793 RepID=A0AAD9G5Q9_9STRA|nr:hypothetical protein P3T76_012277 [Phytophthora citrophthora]
MQYLPSPSEHYSILELLDDMEILEVATKRLQERNLTLLSARDILDETTVDFPDLEDRLRIDGNIVESPAFETGVVKIVQGQENQLTSEEGIAVARLERTLTEEDIAVDSSAKRKRNNEHSSSTTVSKKKRYYSPTLGASVSMAPHGGQLYRSTEPNSTRLRRSPDEVKAAVAVRAKAQEDGKSKCMDLSWLPATSVEVEQFFSAVKCMLG